ncbi:MULTISPECIES: hypothetical protein [Burkholderia]|uniref:hypothetical protein n=1 Tax=Burkholderia TaxID=32008 RepID=UPI0011782675|nr:MULTISPECIES: hypothetical protein [Burkholderia]EKS9796885.1 hypothetical protein [Burkholderia cepacia]EKS9803706.1 hypothetical protein [Burkholderia cepacia]EKS9814737.1 hypothetical protein [Burkholderia cepacia]EKS9817985.1 hypothetical protein [Burkholderia cepacia]EKS9826270.1 hypothetical protein [Burkholderia cepacia]
MLIVELSEIDWQSMSVWVIDSEPGLNRGGLPVAVSRAVQTKPWNVVDSAIRRGEQPAFLRPGWRVTP